MNTDTSLPAKFSWWPYNQSGRAIFAAVLTSVFFYSTGIGSESAYGTLFWLGSIFLAGTGIRYLFFIKNPQSVSTDRNELPRIPVWKNPTAIVVFVCSLMSHLYFANKVVFYNNELAKVEQALLANSEGSGSFFMSGLKVAGSWYLAGPVGAFSTGLSELKNRLFFIFAGR